MQRILSFFRIPAVRTVRGFSNLPPELVLHVASQLHCVHELSSLLRTCRGFACILSPELAKLGVTAVDRGTGRSLLHWAASHGAPRWCRFF